MYNKENYKYKQDIIDNITWTKTWILKKCKEKKKSMGLDLMNVLMLICWIILQKDC